VEQVYHFPADQKPVVHSNTISFSQDAFKVVKKEMVRKDMRAVSKKMPRPERTVGSDQTTSLTDGQLCQEIHAGVLPQEEARSDRVAVR
jgi:translation elongation factor EF-Tu-like GTPase